MRKKIFLIILYLSILSSCNKEEGNSLGHTPHLKYFGFAITDCGQNRISKVDHFVNLVDMCLYDFENINERILINTQGDNSVIIHLQGIFLESIIDTTSPSGIRYHILPDFQERFSLWLENNQNLLIDKIAAFTIADEPAWNMMNMADLAIIARKVKEVFPQIPILVLESSESVGSLTITKDIDWIGFDRYGTINPNQDENYIHDMGILKQKLEYPHQKIVVIMETQWLPYYSELGFDQSVLLEMSESYYQYAKRDESVVALIAYLLPSNFDETGQLGYLDLEEMVKIKIQEIGFDITGNSDNIQINKELRTP